MKRFADTRKQIIAGDAGLIATLTNRHSVYVQQLAQQVWLMFVEHALRIDKYVQRF